MRLIFSRKGFDSFVGRVPSPILESGQLVSFPIPEKDGTVAYRELRHRGLPVSQLLSDLSPGGETHCHLDPDIDASAISRPDGWRPAFGQSGAAAKHLDRAGVSLGDLFLFFGWFRQIHKSDVGNYRYVPGSPHLHVLWGWLRIDEVLCPSVEAPSGLERHPHFDRRLRIGNRVYVARENGAGVFREYDKRLILTEVGQSRSHWLMPGDLLPRGRPPLTYHASPSRWSDAGDRCCLSTVGRGQEFVLDTAHYPGMRAWAENLIQFAG